jgi:hypothetical protein
MASRRFRALGSILLLWSAAVFVAASPQSTTVQSTGQRTLGDTAREQRAQRDGEHPSPTAPAVQQAPEAQQTSLGELANQQRTKRQAEVKVNESDFTRLAAEIDEILEFASRDSGLPRHSAVKYRLVSQADVTQYMAAALSGQRETQRVANSELVLKKFGFLPPDFDLKSYLVTATAQSLGGYYEHQTKTMNLVNWVGLEEQRPIIAHELTHALQDQNYDLATWLQRPERPPAMRVAAEEAMESSARKAVVEGQAMIVYLDYLLRPYGRTLGDTPAAMEFVKERMISTYDTQLVVRKSPLLLKETAMFPYREGLFFELELLKKGGVHQAFAGAFARPPVNTHEVLEPKAYLEGEKTPTVVIPELSGILAGNYETYDSGSIGQLDARILAQQLGSENDMFTVTPSWQGGAYVAAKRKKGASGTATAVSTADIALLYVSRWKTLEAAQRFLEIYQKSLGKRVVVSDQKSWTPAACSGGSHCESVKAIRVDTNEGPVFLELLPDNMVFIAQSFGEETVNSLRQAVLTPGTGVRTRASASDLSLRLHELPAFAAFQEQVGREIRQLLANLPLR